MILQTKNDDSKTQFCENAFQGSSISLPEENTLYINNCLRRNAFYNCSNIRGKLIINGGEIGRSAFFNCTNLVGPIKIIDADIGQSAFEGCISPISDLYINGNYKTITIFERAFYNSGINCPLFIHSKINVIHEYAFSNCFYLKNHPITIYANKICSNAFSHC